MFKRTKPVIDKIGLPTPTDQLAIRRATAINPADGKVYYCTWGINIVNEFTAVPVPQWFRLRWYNLRVRKLIGRARQWD